MSYPTNLTDYEDADVHCPNCGKKTVLVEKGEGDYYVGPECACTTCGCQFHLATFWVPETETKPEPSMIDIRCERCGKPHFEGDCTMDPTYHERHV